MMGEEPEDAASEAINALFDGECAMTSRVTHIPPRHVGQNDMERGLPDLSEELEQDLQKMYEDWKIAQGSTSIG